MPATAFRAKFIVIMPADRYFLDPNGAVTRRMQGKPGDGHTDIAKEVLPKLGITPKDYTDHYDQMFKLKYVRIVEYSTGRVEVEHTCKLSAGQKRHIKALEETGKKLFYVSEHRAPDAAAGGSTPNVSRA